MGIIYLAQPIDNRVRSIDEAKQTILSEFEKHKNFYKDEDKLD